MPFSCEIFTSAHTEFADSQSVNTVTYRRGLYGDLLLTILMAVQLGLYKRAANTCMYIYLTLELL